MGENAGAASLFHSPHNTRRAQPPGGHPRSVFVSMLAAWTRTLDLTAAAVSATAPICEHARGVYDASSDPRVQKCHEQTAKACALREICTNDHTWVESIAPAVLGKPGEKLTYMIAGANKGFNVVSFLRRYANTTVTTRLWLEEQQRYLMGSNAHLPRIHRSRIVALSYATCGRCGGCHDQGAVSLASREVEVHAFELLPDNVAWLRWAFAAFGVRHTLTHAAVGNISGLVETPRGGVGMGYERASASMPSEGSAPPTQGAHLGRAVRLDDYMDQEDIAFAHVVAIDVEGWDGLVLHGLERALTAQRVGVLQAELNGARWVGATTRGLPFRETIDWMWGFGYGCFLETKSGCIHPVSDLCWHKGCGGNIVCGQGPYLRELQSLAQGCRQCSFEQISRHAGVSFSEAIARRAGR